MNTASLGMSVHGEGAGLAWSLDSWCWHSPRPSCPHPVLNSVVTVSHLHCQWSHSEGPLCFCKCSLRVPCRPSAICGVQALLGADILDVCLHQWCTITLAPHWPAVCSELLLKIEPRPFIRISSGAGTVPHCFEVTMLCVFQSQQQTRLRRFWNYSPDPPSHTPFEMYLSYFSLVQEKTCQSLFPLFWAQSLNLSDLIFLTAYLCSQTALHSVCCFSTCSIRFFPILTLEECCQRRLLPLSTLPLVPGPLSGFPPITKLTLPMPPVLFCLKHTHTFLFNCFGVELRHKCPRNLPNDQFASSGGNQRVHKLPVSTFQGLPKYTNQKHFPPPHFPPSSLIASHVGQNDLMMHFKWI